MSKIVSIYVCKLKRFFWNIHTVLIFYVQDGEKIAIFTLSRFSNYLPGFKSTPLQYRFVRNDT